MNSQVPLSTDSIVGLQCQRRSRIRGHVSLTPCKVQWRWFLAGSSQGTDDVECLSYSANHHFRQDAKPTQQDLIPEEQLHGSKGGEAAHGYFIGWHLIFVERHGNLKMERTSKRWEVKWQNQFRIKK